MTSASTSKSGPDPKADLFPLEELNRISANGPEHEVKVLRRSAPFIDLLAKMLGHDERHFSLADLRLLLQRQRQAADAWVMPDHLATCHICLDIFAALQDNGPSPSDAAIRRYLDLWPQPDSLTMQPRSAFPWRSSLMALAAGLAVIATVIYTMGAGLGRSPGRVTYGSGNLSAGRQVALLANAPVPSRQDILTETGMKLVLKDGSQIAVAPHSRFRLSTSWIGQSTLTLAHGNVDLTVTKQTLGRTLVVETPLGTVTVVGTRFQVKTVDENVLVYEQTAGNGDIIQSYREKIESVIVTVSEGVVKVSNTHNTFLVRAGFSAVLRGNRFMIELTPSIVAPLP